MIEDRSTAIVPIWLVLATLFVASGCVSLQSTPQQDYTCEMGHICETAGGIRSTRIERVAPDGRYRQAQPPVAIAAMSPTAPGTSTASSGSIGTVAAPEWQIGDKWQYAYRRRPTAEPLCGP